MSEETKKISITEIANDLAIDYKGEVSGEVADIINNHNATLSNIMQATLLDTIIGVLLEKGIITEDELSNKLFECVNTSSAIVSIARNRDAILQLIEEDAEYLNNLKIAHEDMMNRNPNTSCEPFSFDNTNE